VLGLGRADQAPDRRRGGVSSLALAGADRSLAEDRQDRGGVLGGEVGLKDGESLLGERAGGLGGVKPGIGLAVPKLGLGFRLGWGVGQGDLAPAHFEQAVL
jgi:hypothetical protein